MNKLLTAENYKSGFLVDDEVIAGVTEMAAAPEVSHPIFSAYVSHYLTGETYAYQEFDTLEPALDFLAHIDRRWAYEAVGCSKKKQQTPAANAGSSCGTNGCGSCACG